MRLVVDTSVVVGELLRATGERYVSDARLELFLPSHMWSEVRVELPRRAAARARKHRLDASAADASVLRALTLIHAGVGIVPERVYAAAEDEARARCPRDPGDWPLVACALMLDAAIWTSQDLVGTGVATWTTPTLRGWLDRQPDE